MTQNLEFPVFEIGFVFKSTVFKHFTVTATVSQISQFKGILNRYMLNTKT